MDGACDSSDLPPLSPIAGLHGLMLGAGQGETVTQCECLAEK